MWQALREEAFLKATEARRRAQQVAAAAREILEDARAAIEADDEDDTPAAERADDPNDDESMTVSVLPRPQLPINQERDSKGSRQTEPSPSLAPEVGSARPVSRTESASARTRGPANLSETSPKPSGSFSRPFLSFPDEERSSGSRRRPKRRGLGATPLGALSASTGSNDADQRGKESTDLDEKRRLARQAERTTSQTGHSIGEENPSLDHAPRLGERRNPAIHEREESALTETRLAMRPAQRERNHVAEEEASIVHNGDTDASTAALSGAATPTVESLPMRRPVGRRTSSARNARSETRPTTALASMNVQQRGDVDALLVMDEDAQQEHLGAGTDAGASEWKRAAERSPDIPEQALENPVLSVDAYANTCVDQQASEKVDDVPREEAVLRAVGADREPGIRTLSTIVETNADAQGSSALLCASDSSTHDLPLTTLDERRPSCPSADMSASFMSETPVACHGSGVAAPSDRERRTQRHRSSEDTDLEVVVDEAATMKHESADDLGLWTQPRAGHSPRTASVSVSSTEIGANAATRSEPNTSPVAARDTVIPPMLHRDDDSASAEPESVFESTKPTTLLEEPASERFLMERQGESIPSDKSTSESSSSSSMQISQRPVSWDGRDQNDSSAGAISDARDKNDEPDVIDEQNAETPPERNFSRVFGPRLTLSPRNAPPLATPASSPLQERVVSPDLVAATDASYAEVRQVPEESEELGSKGCRTVPVAPHGPDTASSEKIPSAHQASSKGAQDSSSRIATSIPPPSECTIAGAGLEHADHLASDHASLGPEDATAACANPSAYAVSVAQRPSDVPDSSMNADRQTIQVLRDQLAALTDRYAASQDAAEQWACRYEELRTDYEFMSTELEKLRDHCMEQESNVESLQEALDHALAQLRDAQNESQTSRAAEAEAQAALTDLQRSMASMERRLLEHDERERKLSRALTAMQQSHEASLERREQQHQTQLQALEARLLAMESAAADAQREMVRLRSLLEQNEAQLLSARGEQACLVDELAECRAELEEARTRNIRLRQERNCWKMLLLRHHYRTMLEAVSTEHEQGLTVVANVASATGSVTSTTDGSHADSEHVVVPEPIDIDQVVESTSADEPIDRPFLRQLVLVFLLSDQPGQRQEALDLLLRLLQCTEAERARVAQHLRLRGKRVSLGREFVRFLWRETEPDPGSSETPSTVSRMEPELESEIQPSDTGKEATST
ncbi:hypothetical protein CCYA_CCYA18G4606 [Cyanidiococcus yangmingshanensis]|nr:hypothetical protein CCYA_CCYA18G4606 [Cyanidiococcus yangmingshanensis]